MRRNQFVLLMVAIFAIGFIGAVSASFETFDEKHEGKIGLKDMVEKLNTNFTKLAGATETLSVSKITSVTNISTTATVSGTLGVTGLATLNNLAVNTNATVTGTLGVTGLLSANNITVATNVNVAVLNVTGAKGTPSNVAGLITNGVASMTADATWIPIQHAGTNYWIPAFLKN